MLHPRPPRPRDTVSDCQHPASIARTTTERNVREKFGNTVVSSIPRWPDTRSIRLDIGGPGATLTALPCGHIGVLTPAAAAAHRKAPLMAMLDQPTNQPPARRVKLSGASAQELLDLLLGAARDGEDVDPAAVAAAREQVEIDRLRAEGEAERAEKKAAADEAAARAAVAGPLNAEIADSRANLDRLAAEAVRAQAALLDAVDAHNQRVAEAATAAGGTITSERYTVTAVIGDQAHDYWRRDVWAGALVLAMPAPLKRAKLGVSHVHGGPSL